VEKTFKVSKLIADAGICSRRKAELLIKEGRVKLNNKILTSVPERATIKDLIKVDNKKITSKKETRLWKYYKPVGKLTTNYDPLGRKTIFEDLPKNLPRVITVGRLDFNSEGLLLLTNSGVLARYLELPENSLTRKYVVKIKGKIDIKKLKNLEKGITIKGIKYKSIKVSILKKNKDSARIEMRLMEGKNREIRKIINFLGWKINKLQRISYGPIQLNKLKKDEVEEININKYFKKIP
jgi:23S rRNA pseudouridine2605 synthase